MREGKILWHKYPDEKPLKDGLFLITHKFGNKKEVAIAYLTKVFSACAEMFPTDYRFGKL